MQRRDVLIGLAFGGLGLMGGCSTPDRGKKSSTLRIIHAQNLSNLDPIFTTEPATKDFGYLTYDQLIGVDDAFVPRPQMVEGWSIEDDGRTYVFSLRPGLKFHDGEPVRSQDCIPSIKRWGARDGFGQIAMSFISDFELVDDNRFKIKLKQPFALLPDALGKATSSACFIMPERFAKTDPMKPVTEAIGSGPFRFLKEEWVSGSHAAWARFDGYVPRKEAVSGIAGGRIAKVARVEWSMITDPSTAMAALIAGEQDYWVVPPAELIPSLKADPNIRVDSRLSTGGYLMMQFNHLQPPFNNVAVRQAVAMAVDQKVFMKAAASDPALTQACYGVYPYGTLYASEAGADILKVADLQKARAQLAKSGYAGEKVVLLAQQDGFLARPGQVAEDILRRMGMNVESVVLDVASMSQRRLNKSSTDKGGWSAFLTAWTGGDILNPAVNPMLRGVGETGFPGWATDPILESLRHRWAASVDANQRKDLATAIQVQALQTLPYVPLGSVRFPTAYRKELTGVFPAPVEAYWNIGKPA